MNLVTLPEIKLHLRIDHDDEDSHLTIYADAAEQHIKNFLGDDWAKVEQAPAPIKSAVLLLTGELYANRESLGTTQYFSSRTFELLLGPYITKTVH